MTIKERKDLDMQQLAVKVAEHLPGWQYVAPPEDRHYSHYATIKRLEDGAAVCLHFDSYRQRVSVSGDYPRDERNNIYPWRDRASAITVSGEKDPKTIARDIERRLFPAYLPSYAEGVKMVQERNDTHKRQLIVRDRLRSLLGDVRTREDNQDFGLHHYRQEGGYLSGRVDSDTVTLELRSLPVEKAEAIIKLLLGD